jgi:ribosome biogenesis GTPase / thiamine phosphate phosphatase
MPVTRDPSRIGGDADSSAAASTPNPSLTPTEDPLIAERLRALGWGAPFSDDLQALDDPSLLPARVVALHRGEVDVDGAMMARLPVSRHLPEPPSVGDWLAVRDAGTGPDPIDVPAIVSLLPRRTMLARKAAGQDTRRQVVAANVDLVLVVTSMNQDFNPRRLDRYLAAVRGGGATPIVVLTKADLDLEHTDRFLAQAPPDVDVLVTSAHLDLGLGGLRALLQTGRTIALVGTSGVGKSTLLNALAGDDVQRTQEARSSDDRGKHTTTRRELFVLPTGGIIVDTPGMREMSLWDPDSVALAFPELEALAGACRYRDCGHTSEAGCALLAAAESGDIDPDRLQNWLKLQREGERQSQRLQEQRQKKKEVAQASRHSQRSKLRRRTGRDDDDGGDDDD